jgi:hypothetical protein|tara:strand:+ start:3194 stop:3490 length:297 start_codon:yes stop_codon:yes gene_type:complete
VLLLLSTLILINLIMSESTYEIKPGTFSLFKNDNRTEENKQPHYNGNGKDLSGNDFQVSAWLTESKAGKKYFSCKIQEPYKKEQSVKSDEDSSPDLPF